MFSSNICLLRDIYTLLYLNRRSNLWFSKILILFTHMFLKGHIWFLKILKENVKNKK